MNHKPIDLTVILVRSTEKAVLVKATEDSKPVWLPLSQTEINKDATWDSLVEIIVPKWLALEKGLI